MSDVPDCPLCGTWKCDVCGHKSYYQNPRYMGGRKCNQCGSRKGTFRGVRHISAAVRREHEALNDFLPTTEHKFEHYKSWDQHASFLARQEMEEAMPESPARNQTAQDFAKAEWAKHPAGLFAHRTHSHPSDALTWAIVDADLTVYLHSDAGMAERGDFEIVETSTVITRRRLNQIIDNHETDLEIDIENVITEAGVKIVDDKPLPIPQDFGVRFLAKEDGGPVEWEFVTVRVNDEMMLLCTDSKDYNGMCLPPAEFITRGFHVMEML